MATRVDYANGIDATDIGTIYLTGAGYVDYPFRGASRESALGWEEPVWGGELNRNIDLVLDVDNVDYGLVARCEISYKYLNVQDYKVLCKIAKQKVCKANFFNRETGTRVTQEMAFTGNEIGKLYKFGTEYLGVIDMAIKLVATNRDRQDIISATHTITYNANGGTGTIAQQSVKWAGQKKLADSGFTTTHGEVLSEWNTRADGLGERYLLGQSITVFGDLTLYADWSFPESKGLLLAGLDGNGNVTDNENEIVAYTVTGVGSDFEGGVLNIPNNHEGKPVTKINPGAFRNNTTITELNIGSNVEKIGAASSVGICEQCSALAIVRFGTYSKVKELMDFSFYRCGNLNTIILPDGLEKIGSGAFNYCSTLSTVAIPNSVNFIGYNSFANCSSLQSITIPGSVQTIYDQAFDGCSILDSVTISDGVKQIGTLAFRNCTSLTNITLPSSITTLSSSIFYGCSNMQTAYMYFTSLSNKSENPLIFGASSVSLVLYIPQIVSSPSQAYGNNWNSYDPFGTTLQYYATL